MRLQFGARVRGNGGDSENRGLAVTGKGENAGPQTAPPNGRPPSEKKRDTTPVFPFFS